MSSVNPKKDDADDYGDEFDDMVKTESAAENKPAPKKSFLQNMVSDAQKTNEAPIVMGQNIDHLFGQMPPQDGPKMETQKTEQQQKPKVIGPMQGPQPPMSEEDEFKQFEQQMGNMDLDGMMKQMMGLLGGLNPAGEGGVGGEGDAANPFASEEFKKMMQQEGGPMPDIDESKIKDAQKMFEDVLQNLQKEGDVFPQQEEKKPDGSQAEAKTEPIPSRIDQLQMQTQPVLKKEEVKQENIPAAAQSKTDVPVENLDQFGSMFKNLEKSMQEGPKPQGSTGSAGAGAGADAEDPLAAMLKSMGLDAGAGGPGGSGGEGEMDGQMMNMLKNMMGSLNEGGDTGQPGSGSDAASSDMFGQFTDFLKHTEGDDQFKGILDSVMKDIISKDSLYKPMKILKDEFPDWLEKNWDKISTEDLERYNQQLDKVTEVCELFEKQEGDKSKQPEGIFDKLHELQELGHPPEDLMKKVQEAQVASGEQPQSFFGGQNQGSEMEKLFASLGNLPDMGGPAATDTNTATAQAQPQAAPQQQDQQQQKDENQNNQDDEKNK